MTISTEIYPDIYDPNLGEQHPENVKRQRLYVAARHLLREYFMLDRGRPQWDPPPPDLATTRYYSTEVPLRFPFNVGANGDEAHKTIGEDKIRIVAILGQLLMGGYDDPSMGKLERGVFHSGDLTLNIAAAGRSASGWTPKSVHATQEGVDEDFRNPALRDPTTHQPLPLQVHIVPEFVARFTEMVQHYNANAGLYDQAFRVLRKEGVGAANGSATTSIIRARQLAEVTARLINRAVAPNDPHIVRHVINAMSQTLGGVVDAHPSTLGVELPDLDAGSTVEIIADNVMALSVIYYSAQLEEMKLHIVMDKIVEHFQTGMLPISRGRAADHIYEWLKATPERLTELERRSIYGRTLGLAQGGIDDILPNREFADLWIRFLSTVSQKLREVHSSERLRVTTEQIHKAGRDLAVNLSLHGYGIAHPAGIEMQEIVRKVLLVLDEQDILTAYGVRDRWQLVDRISALYLGGSANGVKYRTMAVVGSRVIRWLAEKKSALASSSTSSLDFFSATGQPTQGFLDLADWCERWLAVAGFAADQSAAHVDPVDLQQQHTVPMLGQNLQLPAAVRNALHDVGGLTNLPVIPQA